MGKYSGLAPEELDTANSLEEAEYLLGEYQLAFGNTWELWLEAVSNSYDNNPTCQCYRRNNFIPQPQGYQKTVSAALDRNPRVVAKIEGGGRNKSERCKICGKSTREGKDLCTEHIGESDYAKRLAAKMTQMAAEDEAASIGKIDLASDNETVRELLLTLKLNGPKTIDRLSQELHRDKKIITNYVNALKKKRLVKTKPTSRGATIVLLPTQ